jgi:serine/threonine-protein kinase
MEQEVIGARYRLDGRLGSGWFGEVHLAHDLHLNYDVAIKLLRKGPDEATSLIREGEYLKALESPYVLHVENADVAGDIGYLATELAAGGSVEDQLPGEGLAPSRVLPIMRQALIGLRACHEYGLIHCDIKPGNVFLRDHDRVALGDFGAAGRVNERGEVRVGGDPRIRAPEMLRGGAGNVRTDIYSAGVTMYRMLTGEWPVDWPGDFKTLRDRVLAREFRDLADLAPHVPGTFIQIVRSAMAPSPSDRFGSAEQLSMDLSRVDLGRQWARIPSHVGHESCWTDAPGGRAARTVCVTLSAGRYQILTRRATGAGSRIRNLCLTEIVPRRLGIELRRVFRAQ